jgi:protein-disulfide isomerase-like protein with CxxC motif
MSDAVLNHLSSGGLATGEHRPWPQALRSRVVAATEAVQSLDIDDALNILETLTADLAALDHAYEASSATAAYRRWKAS